MSETGSNTVSGWVFVVVVFVLLFVFVIKPGGEIFETTAEQSAFWNEETTSVPSVSTKTKKATSDTEITTEKEVKTTNEETTIQETTQKVWANTMPPATTTATTETTTTTTTTTEIQTTETKPPAKNSGDNGITPSQFRRLGVVEYNGWRFTWYSERVLPGGGLSIPGRHSDGDFVRDGDGYICCACIDREQGTVIGTPWGDAKVYDTGCDHGIVDIYVSW